MKTFRKPYRIKKRKSIFRNKNFWFLVLAFIIVGVLFYVFIFLETFQVKKIIITGENKTSVAELKTNVGNNLENELLFFKTKSIFLVDINNIKKDILSDFPQIAEVEIKRGYPDALNIVVMERKETAAWGLEEVYFLVDGEGVIFEECSPDTELIKIVDKKNTPPLELGKKVIEKDYLEKILEAEKKLTNELKIEVREMIVFSDDFQAKTLEGWKIYFSPREDLDWQLTKLNLVLEQEIPPERRKDLEYIELRFGNFAPYKYHEGESVVDVVDED